MLATVTYPYRDRETFAVHLPGERVELTEARLAELYAGGYVDAAAEQPCAPEDAGGDGEHLPAGDGAPAADEPDAPQDAPAPEPTAAQLRSRIEAKGGFAPKKATKEQLAGILESL